MFVLAIETSCDETSLAILEQQSSLSDSFYDQVNSWKVVSSIISSQADQFANYGGVIPEISARNHAEQIFELFELVIAEVGSKTRFAREDILSKMTAIAVTTKPGLASALKVGVEFAKVIKYFLENLYHKKVDLRLVNHLHGHVISAFYQQLLNDTSDTDIFPHLHLLVSGGNTQIILIESPQDFLHMKIVGQTLDDAAGECIDKMGRMLGVDYPAGPKIGKIVGTAYLNPLDLPVSMIRSESPDFSYSGLKTAMRYKIQAQKIPGLKYEQRLSTGELETLYRGQNLNPKLQFTRDALESAQTVVVRQLINQFKKAIKKYNPKSIGLSGGVSANLLLRQEFSNLHTNVLIAPRELTGDNAIMIGLAGMID